MLAVDPKRQIKLRMNLDLFVKKFIAFCSLYQLVGQNSASSHEACIKRVCKGYLKMKLSKDAIIGHSLRTNIMCILNLSKDLHIQLGMSLPT